MRFMSFVLRSRRTASFAVIPGRKEYRLPLNRPSYFRRSSQVRSFSTVFSGAGYV